MIVCTNDRCKLMGIYLQTSSARCLRRSCDAVSDMQHSYQGMVCADLSINSVSCDVIAGSANVRAVMLASHYVCLLDSPSMIIRLGDALSANTQPDNRISMACIKTAHFVMLISKT